MTAAVRRRRLGFARSVGAVMAVALLSACSSNPEPGPLPHSSTPVQATTGTPSPASDPAPSPDGPPTLPAAARGNGPRSAKAFVRYYIATINYAAASGDLRQLRSLGSHSCGSCNAIAHNIGRIYEAGGHIESRGWRLHAVRMLQITRQDATLSLGVILEAEIVVKSAGAQAEHHQGARQPMTAFLTRTRGKWLLSRLDLVT